MVEKKVLNQQIFLETTLFSFIRRTISILLWLRIHQVCTWWYQQYDITHLIHNFRGKVGNISNEHLSNLKGQRRRRTIRVYMMVLVYEKVVVMGSCMNVLFFLCLLTNLVFLDYSRWRVLPHSKQCVIIM